MAFNCKLCSFRSRDHLSLLKHVFEVHSSEPIFVHTCGIKGCPHSFSSGATFASFLSHANRRHCNWRQTLALEAPDDDVTHTSCWLGNFDADDGGPEALGPSHSSISDDSEEGIDLQRTAALFLLTLKEKHRLTQSAVDFAVGSVKQMMTLAYEGSKQSVKEALQSSQDTSDISHAADLDSCFNLHSSILLVG